MNENYRENFPQTTKKVGGSEGGHNVVNAYLIRACVAVEWAICLRAR